MFHYIGVEFLQALKTEKTRLNMEADALRREMDALNNQIRLDNKLYYNKHTYVCNNCIQNIL